MIIYLFNLIYHGGYPEANPRGHGAEWIQGIHSGAADAAKASGGLTNCGGEASSHSNKRCP